MVRLGSWTTVGKRALLGAGIGVMVIATSGVARASSSPAASQAQDPFKFSTNAPVMLGWTIKADKGKDFEEFWATVRAMLSKQENADMKALADSLTKIYKLDAPPVKAADGSESITYIFSIEAPNTALSYAPDQIVYKYLGAGVEGSKFSRPDGDALYKKITDGFVGVSFLWKLIKVEGGS